MNTLRVSVDCHVGKKLIRNRSEKEAKKMKCYKRLIQKYLLQVSSLFGAFFSKLLAETCHSILHSFIWRRYVKLVFLEWPRIMQQNIYPASRVSFDLPR